MHLIMAAISFVSSVLRLLFADSIQSFRVVTLLPPRVREQEDFGGGGGEG
jgi:hypothetical protein